MANKNKLSIYLVKAGLFGKEDIFEKPDEIDVFTTLNESIYEWKAYNCIVAEISLDNCEYCLSNGKWYKINNNFATDINRQYNEIDLFGETFIDYDHGDEDAYNSALVDSLDSSLLLHAYKITTGGQGNNIELCLCPKAI